MSRSKQVSEQQSASLTIRKQLADYITDYIEKSGKRQIEVASELGVKQPRVSDLMRGHIELFSIDTLVEFLARINRRVETEIIRTYAPRKKKTAAIKVVRHRRRKAVDAAKVLPVVEPSDGEVIPAQPVGIPADTDTPYAEPTVEQTEQQPETVNA